MTLVANWLQVVGTSQLVCSKRTSPFSPLIAEVRVSHSAVSNGLSTPSGQKIASNFIRPWKRFMPARLADAGLDDAGFDDAGLDDAVLPSLTLGVLWVAFDSDMVLETPRSPLL